HVAAAFVAGRARAGGFGGLCPPTAPPNATMYRFRDIAVLARRRSTIPFLEIALSRLEIPYVVAGRALYDTTQVRDVAALLGLLLESRDRRGLATVLRGPIVGLSSATLALLSGANKGLAVPLLGRWTRSASSDLAPIPQAERSRLEAFRVRFRDLRAALLRLS